jgi:hypothetical protein
MSFVPPRITTTCGVGPEASTSSRRSSICAVVFRKRRSCARESRASARGGPDTKTMRR